MHKKLRSKRVAPVLIREITRRVHLKGIFQAVYTAGVVLPKPVSTCRFWQLKAPSLFHFPLERTWMFSHVRYCSSYCLLFHRYWHRSLNPKKLIDVKFSHLARNMTMQRTLKLYRLPEETKTPGFRVLEPKDIDQAYQLLNKVGTSCLCYNSIISSPGVFIDRFALTVVCSLDRSMEFYFFIFRSLFSIWANFIWHRRSMKRTFAIGSTRVRVSLTVS